MDFDVINEHSRITLHFAIKMLDGTVIDSNFEADAASFDYGDGSLLPGFEQCLLGLKAGDEQSFTLSAIDAFGEHNPQNVMTFSRSQLDSYEIEKGLVISFADASQAELPGVVVDFDSEKVTVDFNHPLAGKDLQFDVKIVAVSPAEQRESA